MIRRELGSILESWNLATHSRNPFIVGDYHENQKCLGKASLQCADVGMQEGHQHPEEKRARVHDVPAEPHMKTMRHVLYFEDNFWIYYV